MSEHRHVAAGGAAWQVVCAAARPSPSPSDRARLIEACGRTPSWASVLMLSDWHRVTPLVHTSLRHLPAGLVPPPVLDTLADSFTRTVARTLRMAAGCQRIILRLEDAGLSPVTFKGPTLALTAYRSLALRPFDDVDIIVSRETVGRAIEVLESAGLRPSLALTRAQAEAAFTAGRGLPYLDHGQGIALDLHAYLAPRYLPFEMDHERLGGHVHEIDLLGRKVRTLAPEMLLTALCVHGTKHSWMRLSWVSDIAAILSVPGLVDWPKAHRLAEHHRVARMLRLGLLLAERLLDAPLPGDLQPGLEADSTAVRLAARAAARYERPLASRWSGLDAALFSLQAIEGVRDRVRFVGRVAEPSVGDWQTRELPAALGFVHYPLRVLRLVTRGIGTGRPDSPPVS